MWYGFLADPISITLWPSEMLRNKESKQWATKTDPRVIQTPVLSDSDFKITDQCDQENT